MKFKYLLAMMAFIPASMIASVGYAAGSITSISAPASAVQGTPVSVTVNGSGTCEGGYTIYWGDTSNTVVPGTVSIPNSLSHTYSTTGMKTMSIDPGTGCSGGPTAQINITPPPTAFISSITSSPSSRCVKKGSPYKIKVNGTGICATLRVAWDVDASGETDAYTNHNLAASPWLTHVYNSLGLKLITATGSGCIGRKSRVITVKNSCDTGPINRLPDYNYSVIKSIDSKPTYVLGTFLNYRIKVKGTSKGTRRCKLRVQWGDGKVNVYSNYNLSAPTYLYHKYTKIGLKLIKVDPAPTLRSSLCKGSATKLVKITKTFSPWQKKTPTGKIPARRIPVRR
jgi:hypothetical protein